jgi:ribonuclease I
MNFTLGTTIFLIFVQFWAPNNTKLNFTIHGLWAEYFNDSYPEYCNKSAIFNLTQIEYLVPILNVEWVSYEGSNVDFWEHEYLKHGTCFPGVSEEQFFLDTLHLFDDTDSTKTFQENNIKINQTYPKNYLNPLFNGTFQCSEKNNNTITTLWRCYDLNLNKFDCPIWIDNSCLDNITFPFNQTLS